MKLFLSSMLVLTLGGGGYFFWKNRPAAEATSQKVERPTTAIVETRDIHFAVTAAGDIGPADQVSVRPEINGKLSQLPVDLGDTVKKGELLCVLDDQELVAEREQRLAEIDGAKLQLEKASRTFHRNEQLFGNHLISKEIFDDSRTERDLATNSLERADKAFRQVDERLSKTKILAPFDCTVLTRPVSLGQTVSGSAGFNSGTEIMTIANLNDMVVNAHVNQVDVSRLHTNQWVEIQVEAVPGLRMTGVIDRIAPQATVKNNLKGFAGRIVIKDIDPRVRPGMTANLSIPVAAADNVLSVPLAAVFTEQGERYVFVKKDDKFERRSVQIGLSNTDFAEVQNGLEEGETVSLVQLAEDAKIKTTKDQPGLPKAPATPRSAGQGTAGGMKSSGASPRPSGTAGS